LSPKEFIFIRLSILLVNIYFCFNNYFFHGHNVTASSSGLV